MDQLLSLLKSILFNLLSAFKDINRHILFLIYGIFILPTLVLAEGSKEIWVGNDFTGLLLCNDFFGHCGGNGDRTQFAIYNCTDSDRLNFVINTTDEIVYLGFDGRSGGGNTHIVFRIKNMLGDIVKNETSIPTSGIGFINNISEARQGPIALGNPGGYNAIEWTPPDVGTYYIEFQRVNNSTGQPSIGSFRFELFDITVADNSTSNAIPGRVFSDAWQFDSFSNHPNPINERCSGKFYVYSADSIITSVQLSEMQGGYWFLYCNQTGVGTTGDFEQDRKSVPNFQAYLPQYRVFLNEPDTNIFPPASILGSIIPPVIGQTHCNNGEIDFLLEVDKAGAVEIELNFDPPYVTRTVTTTVVAGVNIINWDGFDGTEPDSLAVPNNTNISFTVSYINGLTNLPLYDIESNNQGFVIELVYPEPSPNDSLFVFWDDSNIGSGGGGVNLSGCFAIPAPWFGCHSFSDGDYHTMNTWWYAASQSTAPVIIIEERGPDSLEFNQSTQNYCADSIGIPISVTVDPNSETYHWFFTGNDVNINQNNPSDNFITIDLGPNATTGNIGVYGYNNLCGYGEDTSYLFIGIQELPIAIAGPDTMSCDNSPYTLASASASFYDMLLWTGSGDGSFNNSSIENPTYTPGVNDIINGSVVLTLMATPTSPCTGNVTDNMTLYFGAESDAGSDYTICQGDPFDFSNTVILADSNNCDSIIWLTNGAGTFNDPKLIHPIYNTTPTEIGDITFSLVAYGALPCGNDTSSMILTVDSVPTGNFTYSPIDTCCVAELVAFDGSSTCAITSWQWDFGDGNIGSGQNVTHPYLIGDSTYNITLTILNGYGCAETILDSIYVDSVNVGFNMASNPTCLGDTVYFTGTGDTITYTNWNWDFGDGSSLAVGRDVSHVYNIPGQYNIKLMVCNDTTEYSITVNDTSYAHAGSNETLCESTPFDFSSSVVLPSASSYDSLLWYGGAGNFSEPRILLPVYTPGVGEEGPVELFLVTYGLLPCSNDTSSMILTLDSLPEPSFNFVPNDSICINEMISFTGINNNTTSITDWDWDFGDGSIDMDQNPFYAYSLNGVFDVQLTLTNSQGCIDSTTQQITVNQLPDGIITIGPNDSICALLPLNFGGTDDNGTTVTDWDWDFGDGSSLASGQNVNHTYLTPGTYSITLYLTNDNSCLDTAYATVVVHTLPLSDFTIAPNDTVCINETVTFDGSDISGTNITSWDWDFADGNLGTGQSASNVYTTPFLTVDSVRLIATNENGCVDTAYQNIWVNDPNIGFNLSPKPACFGDTIAFTGTGDIVTYTDWNWNFGDGSTHVGRDTVHYYATTDTFEITLSVCSITLFDSAFVYEAAASNAGSDESLCESFPFDFATSTIQPTAFYYDSLLWYGGVGSFSDSKTLLPVYTPGAGEEGPVQLTMVAYGLLPCSNDTASMILTLDSLPEPSFSFVPNDSICIDELINFSGINNNTSSITNWNWKFGDNSVGAIQNPTHAYTLDGFYDVQLTVTNIQGCVDSITNTLQVHPLPDPDFTVLPNDTICAELPLTFDGFDNAGTTVTDWSWDFGDGNITSGQNVSHTYTSTGDYIVTLTALNDNSCTQIHTRSVHIHALPQSNFTISPNDSTCVNELINLDASNITSDITSWNWQFGDGNTDVGQNVSHTYTDPTTQTYNILSIYQNANGCLDTTTHQRYVQNVSAISFNIIPSPPTCQDFTVDFQGTPPVVTFTPWNWTYGDGSAPGLGHNTSHVYITPDTVDVILDVCSVQEIQQLIINAPCQVDAGSNEITCQDVYFDLSTSSTPPTADDFSAIAWYTDGLGTIDDATLLAPTYFPHPSEGSVQNDTITLTMVGVGISPCENDTSTMELVVIPGAYAQAGSDENSCFGDPYNFANSTDSAFATNYVTLYWLTSGTGSFVNPNVERPIYIPGPNEIGPVTLTMVAANVISCDSIDDMVLTIRPTWEMPVDITVCYYDSVFAQGAWRYSSGIFYDTLLTANYGCDSVIVTNLTVRPKVDRDFVISTGDSICNGETVSFTSTGTANLTSWLWDFGDGNTSTVMNPTHQYNTSGLYTVIYYYTDDNGCSDSATNQVTVFELPDVDFTINMTNACVNTQVGFNGTSTSNIALWEWDFGDGQSGAGQNTSHVYTTWGAMTIVLTVTDINGCQQTSNKYITIAQPPIADFTYSSLICDSIQFTDLSTSAAGYNIVTWAWDFGDGGTSALQNPTHQYPSNTTPGGEVYMVILTIAADSNGFICTDSVVLPVIVPSLPDIFFTWTPDPTCLGDTTYFYGESGFYIDSWHWDFDDGNFSTNQYATHVYTNTGTYTVTLTIQDTLGCTNTLSNIITVDSIPDVSFTMSDSVSCHGTEIQFTSTTSTNVETWYWDFGDGSFSPDQNPIHYYPTGGSYTVTLTVTDSTGCSNTATNNILILPSPTADYSYQNITCSSVVFTDESTAPMGYNLVEWFWDFDDGFTATVQNPSHSFAGGIGVYNVMLIVTADSSGYSCQDTIIQTVLTPGLPTVFFTWDPEPTMLGDVTSFYGTSGNTIIDWYWDFDDGNFATTQDATNTFATIGTFDVELIVTDIDGCINSVIHQVTITNVPDLDYHWDNACQGDEIQFYIDSPPTDIPAVVSWSWSFGDGGVSSDMEPTHVYVTASTYNVSLTIVDTMGATNTVIKPITVNPLPTALFSIDSPTCEGNPVQFHDYSTTPTGFITEWLWNFGDGNTTTVVFPNDPDVTHTYAATGTYIVTLTITNSDSCTNSTQNPVTTIPSPMAMFTSSSGCASGPVSFTDTSIENGGGTIISWAWNFDDPASGPNNTSTLQNPVHQFSAAGDYNVQLIITNVNGCSDTTQSTVTVADQPEVEFTYTEVCLGSQTSFTSITTSNVATYTWSFGDGGTSNLQNPTHTYGATGDYIVTLTIVTTDGCTASVTHTVRINPLPNPNFAHTGPVCLNDTVYFTDLSSSPNGAITTWHWDFGDGTEVTINAPDSPDVSHIYTNNTTFAVTLTVTDSDTCENTIVKQVQVVSSPLANYTFAESCYNDPTYFTDLSSTNGGPDIYSWQWFFGDPNSGIENTSTLQNPTHIFSTPDVTYTTTLIIINTLGCTDSISMDIVVDSLPNANIGILDDSICLGESVVFSGISTSNISSWYWEFGDGGSSIEQNPSYSYGTAGFYIVTLTVTEVGTDECENFTTASVYVNQIPDAMFEFDNTCLGEISLFSDQSSSQYGFIETWKWYFGDGSDTTVNYPGSGDVGHIYLNNDTYTVKLVVTDNFGCKDSISLSLQVYDVPVPSFSWQQVCDPLGQVHFFDESEQGGDNSPIVSWNWELDDGYYSTEIDPSYVYDILDTCYTVLLTVTDNNGCFATDTNIAVCLYAEMDIDFTSSQVCENDTTIFTVTGTLNDSIAYIWNFNDGSPPNQVVWNPTMSHVFPNSGMFIVELMTIDTSNDCSATILHQVVVDSLPKAQFTNTIGSCDIPTEFTDISLGGGEFIESWLWDFGDIISPNNTSTLQNPTHLYGPSDSTYQVKLVVTNFNGCMDSILQDVYVEACVIADFSLPDTTNCARSELCFVDNSTLISTGGEIVQWRWDFGDGYTYNYGIYQDQICHTYATQGDYEVQLVLIALVGGNTLNDTIIKTFTVNPTPIAGMLFENSCLNDITMFYDNTTNNGSPVTSWHWNFGNTASQNDTANVQDTSYLYPQFGNYIPELLVRNGFGCIDSIFDTVTIYKLPEAAFSYEEQCMSYYTYFVDESLGDSSVIIRYNWSFGDPITIGDTSDMQNPAYIYDTTGYYTVALIVGDGNLCVDTITQDVEIYPIPTANFVIRDTIQQGNIYLDNISIGAIGYYWDFDYDYGESSTQTNPTHQYDVDGNYTIMLVSYNDYNCPDTTYQIYDLLFTNLFVPNAFVPSNSNPELQTFKPIGINLKSYHLEVYSAWGNLVFQSTQLDNGAPAEGWDGKYKNNELPTGSYVWRISAVFEDGSIWKGTDNGDGNTATSGTITLIR